MMDENDTAIEVEHIASVNLAVFSHSIRGKTLYSYVVTLPNGDELKPDYLYSTALEAIRKSNGRLYGWLKNRK